MQINSLLQQGYAAHQQGDLAAARELYLKVLAQVPENQDALVLLGSVNYELEHYDESVRYFQQLLNLAPERTDFLSNLGAALQMIGRPEEATPVYRRVLQVVPEDPATLYNLASTLKDCGEIDEAGLLFERLLELSPDYAKAHNNFAVTCKLQGKVTQAIEHFRRAVTLEPAYTLAWQNLADLLQQEGHWEDAEDAYLYVLDARPQDATLHYKLGLFYQQQGRLLNSLHHFQTAVELSPRMAEAWRSLGATQQGLGQFEASLLSFRQALEVQPVYPEALIKLGNSHRELGQMQQAQQAYQQALEQDPADDANRVRLATLLPPIYSSRKDMHSWRQRFADGVQALQDQELKLDHPVSQLGQTNFYLAYQGGDDKPLQQAVAELYRPLLPERVEAATASPPSPQTGRLRVGFVSAFLYNHSITHYYGRHIELMAAEDEIELTLLQVAGGLQDQVTNELKTLKARCLQLPDDLERARQLIADLHLDVLIYSDIGLEPFTYFLAFTRLAPLQCVLPGHPVTTGIPTVDVFVSNLCNELPEAQDFYSEQLVALDSLPVWYRRPKLPEHFKSRSELGLKDSSRIYLCPMTLFKVHPEMDQALAEILETDPEAEIHFFRFKQTLLHEQLQQRFERSVPGHQRIKFLPWADSVSFFSLLDTADVLLDTFHFGGGSTHFLCFAVGTPVITWPSAYLRGRSGAGLYHKMGITEAIAPTQADYSRLAVEIARDPDLRVSLKTRIRDQRDYLFENDEGPRAFVSWLKSQQTKN